MHVFSATPVNPLVKIARVSGIGLLSALVLAGCSSPASAPSITSTGSSGSGVCDVPEGVADLGTLVVGNATGTYSAPYIEWGIEQGCFAKYGLTIENVSGTSQASRVAGLVGGSMDVIVQAPRFVVQTIANAEFDPLIISSHYEVSLEELDRAKETTTFDGEFLIETSMISAPGSGIGTFSELVGERVAVTSTREATAVGLERISQELGLPENAFSFVELDQQEGLNALLRGDVGAASLNPAFALIALAEGGQFLGYPVAYSLFPGSQFMWLTTREINAERPETIIAFRKAMWEIYEHLGKEENEEALRSLIVERYGVPPEVDEAIIFPTLTPRQVTLEELQLWVPELLARGDIDSEITLDESILLGP